MTFEIEKGVPIPPKKSKLNKYPFHAMEPGDSFLIPLPPEVDRRTFTVRVTVRVAAWRKATGYRFTIRTMEGGVRVWRVE